MEKIIKDITDLIYRAGKLILSAHDQEKDGNVAEKNGDAANMVTKYDVAVQELLISEIKKLLPEAYYIAEEKNNEDNILDNDYCFIIDPIDGTANFVHDYRHSCISLALFSHSEAIFGAVYDPYLDEMFTAEKGRGAFLNGKRITVTNRGFEHSILAFGTSPYDKKTLGDRSFKICHELFMECSDVRRCGTAALDLAYLAAGRNDMFFECLLYPWDYAAGQLLVKEAGGIATDMDGEPLKFNRRCSVLAATPTVYDRMLKTVKNIK